MSIVDPVQNTSPPVVSQSSMDDLTWGVDYTALLTGAQTITAPTATLIGPTGQTVTLEDACYVTDNSANVLAVIAQRIRAGVLTASLPGPTYYILTVTGTPSGGSTNVFAERLRILVPF